MNTEVKTAKGKRMEFFTFLKGKALLYDKHIDFLFMRVCCVT